MKPVLVRLEPETIEAIKSHPLYQEPVKGRAGGGVAGWLRAIARQECGLGSRLDPHEEQSKKFRSEKGPG